MSYVPSATDIQASVTAARRSLDRERPAEALAHLERATGGLRRLGRTATDPTAFQSFASLDRQVRTAHDAGDSDDPGAPATVRTAMRAADHLLWALADDGLVATV